MVHAVISSGECVKWDPASLETDLVGRPRLQQDKSCHAEVCLSALWSKHPQTFFIISFFANSKMNK